MRKNMAKRRRQKSKIHKEMRRLLKRLPSKVDAIQGFKSY